MINKYFNKYFQVEPHLEIIRIHCFSPEYLESDKIVWRRNSLQNNLEW